MLFQPFILFHLVLRDPNHPNILIKQPWSAFDKEVICQKYVKCMRVKITQRLSGGFTACVNGILYNHTTINRSNPIINAIHDRKM